MTPKMSRDTSARYSGKKVRRVTVLLPEHDYEMVRVLAEVDGVDRGPYLWSRCVKALRRDFDRLLTVTRSVR